jgi:hypothetical protein
MRTQVFAVVLGGAYVILGEKHSADVFYNAGIRGRECMEWGYNYSKYNFIVCQDNDDFTMGGILFQTLFRKMRK